MAFASVPSESKSRINKAGEILVRQSSEPVDLQWARELADKWRACHAYPINTFQATLRKKLHRFKHDPIAAQRLKRMPTIIDKLKRYPNMNLTTMQDIGGVRAILDSVSDVYELTKAYQQPQFFAHELIDMKDYIKDPRDEDGYRSLHLIYRYKNRLAPAYNGLRLELQVRTRMQHTWATAVETMGTFLGQALKSRQGDKDWLDFFAITSSAFAHKENCAPVPRFRHLSAARTFKAVAAADARLQALDKMKGFSAAVKEIAQSEGGGKSWFYHLIVLNSLERTVTIAPYDRDSINQAMADYSKVEARAVAGEKIEPVLVSAGPIDRLRRAYPNFFLDMEEFVNIVAEIIKVGRRTR